MFAALTGLGLSAAAGLNAYIPFLIVALFNKFTDVLTLPPGYEWISSWWSIGIATALLVSEVVLDKIPAVDTVNDAVGTFVRPSVGGVIGAATQAAGSLDNAGFMRDNPWIGAIGGVVVAGLVHSGKMAVRPVANVSSGGVAAPVLSTVEDATSLGLSLIALLLPLLVIVVLVALVYVGWRVVARSRRLMGKRRPAG